MKLEMSLLSKNMKKNLAELFHCDDEIDNEKFYELFDIFPFDYTERVEK